MNEDLKIIKKYYGEKMMHLCRELFSTILEKKGMLSKIMLENFAPSRFLYDDVVNTVYRENSLPYLEPIVIYCLDDFKDYIYNLYEQERQVKITTDATPKQLLELAGYDLYECKTEEDIQQFKKYYKVGEELCTFNGGRLDRCYVFFAIKKNVNEIKRNNFKFPERQDEYGTSVISIQFSKGRYNTLSIKNRYNHTVDNPDATFSNNLENIISGLTNSFEKEYGLNINQNKVNNLEIPGYVLANDGRYYKYNYEINNIYYCPNNIIIDNFEVKEYEHEKYIILDYFVLNLSSKTIEIYDKNLKDSFVDGIQNIEKINITKSVETGNKSIEIETKDQLKITIDIDKTNRIIGYKNENLTIVGDNFLSFNKELTEISLPNVKKIKNRFLIQNNALINLDLPKVQTIGNNFLYFNKTLESISLPEVQIIEHCFLYNSNITKIALPKVRIIGCSFLKNNKDLTEINLQAVEMIEYNFLSENEKLTKIELPNAHEIADNFLESNEIISILNLPKVEIIGDNFLFSNKSLTKIELPKVKMIGDYFLFYNCKIFSSDMPLVESVGSFFLNWNSDITTITFPRLHVIGEGFLNRNEKIEFAHVLNYEQLDEETKILLQKRFKIISQDTMIDDYQLYGKVIIGVKKSYRNLTEQIKEVILNNIKESEIGGNYKK